EFKPPVLRHCRLRTRLICDQLNQETGVGIGSHRRDSRTILDNGIFDLGPRRTSPSSCSISCFLWTSSVWVVAGWMIHKGAPLSVTWTDLPVRVRRLTFNGSRSSVRNVTFFILSDSSG